MRGSFDYDFEINERVYLNLPDSDIYLVTDVRFSFSQGVLYEIMDSSAQTFIVRDFEITKEKQVI